MSLKWSLSSDKAVEHGLTLKWPCPPLIRRPLPAKVRQATTVVQALDARHWPACQSHRQMQLPGPCEAVASSLPAWRAPVCCAKKF